MDVELAHRRIVCNHLGGMVGGDADFFLRRQQIKLIWFQNETTTGRLADELPEVRHLIMANFAEINGCSVFLCLVGNDVRPLAAFQVHRH